MKIDRFGKMRCVDRNAGRFLSPPPSNGFRPEESLSIKRSRSGEGAICADSLENSVSSQVNKRPISRLIYIETPLFLRFRVF